MKRNTKVTLVLWIVTALCVVKVTGIYGWVYGQLTAYRATKQVVVQKHVENDHTADLENKIAELKYALERQQHQQVGAAIVDVPRHVEAPTTVADSSNVRWFTNGFDNVSYSMTNRASKLPIQIVYITASPTYTPTNMYMTVVTNISYASR